MIRHGATRTKTRVRNLFFVTVASAAQSLLGVVTRIDAMRCFLTMSKNEPLQHFLVAAKYRVVWERFPTGIPNRSKQMKWFIVTSIAIACVAAGAVVAADLKSGLQVGEDAGAFNVKDITGPNKGKSLCYR